MVEFALILMVFLLVTVGLLDGLRVIFYYTQIQEAAREGARWAAVQVARTTPSDSSQSPWGTFTTPGNAPGIYCDYPGQYFCPSSGSTPLSTALKTDSTNPITNTVVGAASAVLNDVNLNQVTVTIATSIAAPDQGALEVAPSDPRLSNQSVSVTIQYPFKPILSVVFGGVTIPLQGTSTMLHE